MKSMPDPWNNDQPIYKQLRDRVAGLIMHGSIAEGDSVPSVRQVSAEQKINHITVAKAYQELVDEGVLIMKRGLGMFVLDGARKKLITAERTKFKQLEVPALHQRLTHLGISISELQDALKNIDKTKQSQ
jgi:GntR family transcriptional regulator